METSGSAHGPKNPLVEQTYTKSTSPMSFCADCFKGELFGQLAIRSFLTFGQYTGVRHEGTPEGMWPVRAVGLV